MEDSMFGFMNNLFTKKFLSLGRYLDSCFTLNDIKKDEGLSRKPIRRMLNLMKQGYVKRDDTKMPYKYYLTEKYKQLYYKIMEELPIS